MKNYKYLSFITGIFTATLLISNTLDTKIFTLGPLNLPSGIILFPLAYIFGDVLTEVYGYAASRKVIWTGFVSLLLMILTYEVARLLPAAPFWPHQEAFQNILGHVPRIVLASITAYFVGEFCNSYVLAKIKVWMQGRAMPFRFVASTVVGQAVDTTVFVLIAFGGLFSASQMASLIFSGWAFKVVWEVIALPLTLVVVKRLKKAEGEDYFDINTNFNPFHLSKKTEVGGRSAVVSATP
jgi:queuosine precursor transporter